MSEDTYISILFDGPPSHESGRFVEVNDPSGASINAGEWRDYGTGLHELRIENVVRWRPIETARKCSEEIMVCGGTYYDDKMWAGEEYKFDGVSFAMWDRNRQAWRGENCGGHDEFFWHKPTHWAPKPHPHSNG